MLKTAFNCKPAKETEDEPYHRLDNRTNLLIFTMLILRMKPLLVAVVEGEGGRESEQYNTEKL